MSTEAVKSYLNKGPPYIGDCRFEDKDKCKELGARWHPDSKKWKATDDKTLMALCKSGKWSPLGFTSHMTNTIVQVILDRDRESEKKAIEAIKAKEAEQEKKMKYSADKDLMVPPDEADALEEVSALGVTQEMIDASGAWADLGPRSGISNVARLKRGVRFGIVTWEEVVAGRVNYDSKPRSKPSSKTGAQGERGAKGVKRGVQEVESGVATRQNDKKQKADEPLEEDAQQARPNAATPAKPKLPAPDYCYTSKCNECGTDLDSSKQFGLECVCAEGNMWSACKRCLVPVRKAEHCRACGDEIKAWLAS